jgi:type II secretory pathway pseudopilin PulG
MHAGCNTQRLRSASRAAAGRWGFTLVEVMISVALVLFLIIGVNQVFKMTTDTVGAGQVLSLNIRDARAAQEVLQTDLAAGVQKQPMFIIASSRVSAFRNVADRLTDRDWSVGMTPDQHDAAIRSLDLNGDNDEGDAAVAPAPFGELTPPAIYNHRNHRTDRLAFFARDVFQRQTADDGAYTSRTQSGEAWVWYGHLRLSNNAAAPGYFQPGQMDAGSAKNDNNALASQFALGRMVMLLVDPTSAFPVAADEEQMVQRQPRYPRPAGGAIGANPKLTPLSYESMAPGGFRVWDSRYDLAETTLSQFQTDLDAVAAAKSHWWQRFLYTVDDADAEEPTPVALNTLPADYRFRANRFFTKPLTSQKAAELSPILMNGVGQFIVEFAGDYVTQDPTTGAVAAGSGPDGVTDFVIDTSIGTNARSIRWYGMPRDVAGGVNGGPDGRIMRDAPQADVLPVRDVRGVASPFERRIATELPVPPGSAADNYAAVDGMAPNARYTCVWGPDVDLAVDPLPQMLRITLVLEDENGRLAEGQQYEYVVDLPY